VNNPRKLTFQLTPLLDLLLIVIFAQYMEVQDTSRNQQAELKRAAEAQLAQLRESIAAEQSALEQERQILAEQSATREQRVRRLENRNVELAEALEQTIKHQSSAGDLVAELFQVPEELIQQVLQPGNSAPTPRSPEELDRLKAQFRQLAGQRGRDVIEHLLTFGEIRKRCDIWELYVGEDSVIAFEAAEHRSRFRAESADEFVRKLFERYKSLTQPKSLVVILVSWGDAKRGAVRIVLNGLPMVANQMNADSDGRTRFEYAVFGFHPRTEASGKDTES